MYKRNKYNGLDVFAILTQDVREEIRKLMEGHNNHTKCLTIPNFQPLKKEVFSNNVQECHKPYCIAVGRLSLEKGFDRLIDIWSHLKKHYNEIPSLLIVGEGPEKAHLQELIRDAELDLYVRLIGQRDNDEVQTLMKNALCYCMSSYSEGFPLVLLESLSTGTPQIAFDVRVGPRNLIIDNQTGFLIEDGDHNAYAEKIIQLHKDRYLRDRLSIRSIERARDFSEDRIMSIWENVISNYFE